MWLRSAESLWPVVLDTTHRGHHLELRPMRKRDEREWLQLRARNRAWTGPWDATLPFPQPPSTFRQLWRAQEAEARAGRMLPWVLTVDGQLAGQVHIFGVMRAAQLGGTIGYWIDERWAGRGITPVAVALALECAFADLGLHRIEINIRPENVKSLRVVEKLQLREEGLRREFLHIDGAWRDHRSFAVLATEREPGELLARVSQK